MSPAGSSMVNFHLVDQFRIAVVSPSGSSMANFHLVDRFRVAVLNFLGSHHTPPNQWCYALTSKSCEIQNIPSPESNILWRCPSQLSRFYPVLWIEPKSTFVHYAARIQWYSRVLLSQNHMKNREKYKHNYRQFKRIKW